jgi:hypothetical protein
LFERFEFDLAGHIHGDHLLEVVGILLVEHVAVEATPVMGNQYFVLGFWEEFIDGVLEVLN